MNVLWIASMVLQWVVIAALCLAVVSMLRQMGALATRVEARNGADPEAAVPEALFVGARLEPARVALLGGGEIVLGGHREHPQLAVFIAPGCTPCEEIEDAVRRLGQDRAQGSPDLVLVLGAQREVAEEYAQRDEIADVPVAVLEDYPRRYFPGRTPSALALSASGMVAARGMVRNLDDLEDMVRAASGADDGEAGNGSVGVGIDLLGASSDRVQT